MAARDRAWTVWSPRATSPSARARPIPPAAPTTAAAAGAGLTRADGPAGPLRDPSSRPGVGMAPQPAPRGAVPRAGPPALLGEGVSRPGTRRRISPSCVTSAARRPSRVKMRPRLKPRPPARPGTVGGVEQPVVHAHGLVQPHGVVQARGLHARGEPADAVGQHAGAQERHVGGVRQHGAVHVQDRRPAARTPGTTRRTAAAGSRAPASSGDRRGAPRWRAGGRTTRAGRRRCARARAGSARRRSQAPRAAARRAWRPGARSQPRAAGSWRPCSGSARPRCRAITRRFTKLRPSKSRSTR